MLLLLACYFVSRGVFTLLNIEHFKGLGIAEFFSISFYALRFDLSILLVINAVYIILLLLPMPIWRMPRWEKFTQWFFVICNAIPLAFEVSDWAYFRFTRKRATADVLDMVGRKEDFINQLPHFVVDYWYVPLGLALIIFLLVKLNNSIRRATPLARPDLSMNWIIAFWQTVQLVIVAGLILVGIRGGIQPRPVNISSPGKVTESAYIPVAINTPFSILHSYASKQLERLHYYRDEELVQRFNPIKQFTDRDFNKKNVVIIILESFSEQFTGIGRRISYTPFLDSLMEHSFVCYEGFANALHSAEAIPAIISGIPSLMNEPFTTSAYCNNKITSIPNLLKPEGYSSAFYHGGTNGTMNFDVYCSHAGYDKYYGRTEYNNEADYDGNWGIWDEPFLQYFARGLNKMKQPFVGTVFTLTSHDPFKVPEQYRNTLPTGKLPIQQCIAYTDMALKKFFETAQKQPWFKNTLFVLMADHYAPIAVDEYYFSHMGAYAIPIVFYAPDDSLLTGGTQQIVQHIDILPSVMDYVGYKKPFYALGNSAFRATPHRYTVNELNGEYQWVMDGYLMKTKDMEPTGLFAFPQDTLCVNNLIKEQPKVVTDQMLPAFRSYMQLFRAAMIDNKLCAEPGK